MIRNYLITALRVLNKQKFFTAINVLGLAVGIACCMVMLLYVKNELSYDKYHANINQLYRIVIDLKFGDIDGRMSDTAAPMAKTMVKDYPEVINAGRTEEQGGQWIKRGENESVMIEDVAYVDSSIFQMFSFDVVAGDPVKALTNPDLIVISRRIADLYFPDEDPMGKSLTIGNDWNVEVAGLIENMPEQSSFKYDVFLSMERQEWSKDNMWLNHTFETYFQLAEGADPAGLEAKFPDMLEKYVGPELMKFIGATIEEFRESGKNLGYGMQPVADIHLHSQDIDGVGGDGNIRYVYIFTLIALMILLIASINFINLSTAKSAVRAREVGIRKVMGSIRSMLVGQFLTESVIMSLMSFFLAIGIGALFLPIFNSLAQTSVGIPWGDPFFWAIMILGALVLGIVTGMYPAFFLSAFKPVKVLKGNLTRQTSSGWLRSGLVIFQFVASIVLIISTLIVRKQITYIQNKDLGFNKEHVVIVENTWVLRDKAHLLKKELVQREDILSGSVTNYLPVNSNRSTNAYWLKEQANQNKEVLISRFTVDFDYVETYGLEIVEGRNLSVEFPTDSQAVLINEVAAMQLGIADNPIGREISSVGDMDENGNPTYDNFKIVGILKDFHFSNAKELINPLALFIGNNRGAVSFRIKSDDLQATLADMEVAYKRFAPDKPFQYSFVDDRFEEMYETEQRLGKIFGSFSILAIFIACLGLFALATFMAERRAKEISIRRVMGARVSNIMLLLSSEFLKLVGLALIFAVPVSYYLMQNWLEGFAYRVDLGADVFIISGIIALMIAQLTVSFQSMKAALANPVTALRNE